MTNCLLAVDETALGGSGIFAAADEDIRLIMDDAEIPLLKSLFVPVSAFTAARLAVLALFRAVCNKYKV